MNKNIKLYGRRIPVIAILIAVLVIGIASAALVSSFVTHETLVRVSAPVELDLYSHELDLYSGECTEDEPISMNITNHANVDTYAGIVTTVTSTEYGTEDPGPETGICVYYTDDEDDVITEITIPANETGQEPGDNTLEIFMHICTAPSLDPVDYTISTNFTPSSDPCETETPE